MSHATPATPGEQRNSLSGLSYLIGQINAASNDLAADNRAAQAEKTQRDCDALKALIGEYGLANVILMLRDVVGDIALEAEEDGRPSSLDWQKAADALDETFARVDLRYQEEA